MLAKPYSRIALVMAAAGCIGALPLPANAHPRTAPATSYVVQHDKLEREVPSIHVWVDPVATTLAGTSAGSSNTRSAPPWGLDRMEQPSSADDGSFVSPSSAGEGVTAYGVDTGVEAALTDVGGRVGDGATDACGVSPMSAPAAFTTGALTEADYSTVGSCLDDLAPGSEVVSLATDSTGSARSGTSMAAPPASGAAALFLGQVPSATPTQSTDSLLSGAVSGVIDPGEATTNRRVTTLGLPSPGQVMNLRAVTVSTTTVLLAWDAPEPIGPESVIGYVLVGRDTATGETTTQSYAGTIRSALLERLVPNSDYSFTVAATSLADSGPPSAPATVHTLWAPVPGAPKDIAVSMVTAGSADISWSAPDPVAGIDSVRYEVDYRPVGGSAWNKAWLAPSGHLDTTLELAPGVAYEVTVIAQTSDRSGAPATPVMFTTASSGPGAPTELASPDRSTSTVSLAWVAPAGPLTGYLVQWRAVGEDTWTSMNVTGTRATVAGLSPRTSHQLRVLALDGNGTGRPTPALDVSTLAELPGVPTDVRVVGTTTTSVALEWSPPTSGAPVGFYVVECNLGTSGQIPATASGVQTGTVVGLVPGAAVSCTVVPYGLDGLRGPGATIEARADYTPPRPPTWGAALRAPTSLTVQWSYVANESPGPPPTTGFDIEYRAAGTETWSRVRTPADPQTTRIENVTASVTLAGLTPATTYELRIRTIAGDRSSEYTSVHVASTTVGTPQNLRLVTVTPTTAELRWDDTSSGAPLTGHVLRYGTTGRDAAAWDQIRLDASDHVTLTGLKPGTEYGAAVKAVVGGDESDWTGNWITFATPRESTATERYVKAVYRDLFQRDPDPSGLATWTGALDRGTARAAVANSITGSTEYRSRLIQRVYRDHLGRGADSGGLTFWLGQMGRGWTVQQIEGGFIASDEYYARAGRGTAGWVACLYHDVLGRDAAASEISYWSDQMAAGGSRTEVAAGFLLSTEHLTTVVDGYYVDLLRRHLDPAGRASWVAAIQRGTRVEDIIGGIVASDEYYGRAT